VPEPIAAYALYFPTNLFLISKLVDLKVGFSLQMQRL
jgi:hypothetical protein